MPALSKAGTPVPAAAAQPAIAIAERPLRAAHIPTHDTAITSSKVTATSKNQLTAYSTGKSGREKNWLRFSSHMAFKFKAVFTVIAHRDTMTG